MLAIAVKGREHRARRPRPAYQRRLGLAIRLNRNRHTGRPRADFFYLNRMRAASSAANFADRFILFLRTSRANARKSGKFTEIL
jgi:hypothetical protein